MNSLIQALFGALGDSAPDRWGCVLMRRAERRQAKQERRVPRTLREIDYLLMVNDEARQGALRFARSEGGPFVREGAHTRIPPLKAGALVFRSRKDSLDQRRFAIRAATLVNPASRR